MLAMKITIIYDKIIRGELDMELGIKIFSVTDHDTIGNIDKMKKLVKNEDLIFIPGVEISGSYKGKEIHLLTYGNSISEENEKLMDILNKNRLIRTRFEDDFMKFVAKKFNFSFNEYLTYIRNPKNGGWKAENFLKEREVISSLPDIFKLIDESGVKISFRNPEEIINELKEIGLIVILAHPPAYFKGELLNNKNYCRNNNMLIMSGSDYHGDFVKTRKLGKPERYISEKSLEKLLELL